VLGVSQEGWGQNLGHFTLGTLKTKVDTESGSRNSHWPQRALEIYRVMLGRGQLSGSCGTILAGSNREEGDLRQAPLRIRFLNGGLGPRQGLLANSG
jgi:hypothetical protein